MAFLASNVNTHDYIILTLKASSVKECTYVLDVSIYEVLGYFINGTWSRNSLVINQLA